MNHDSICLDDGSPSIVRDSSPVDARVNMLVSINPNDHAVIGLRTSGPRFDWYHFTSTGMMETHLIGGRPYRAQPAVFTRHNQFQLRRVSGSLFGFRLPEERLEQVQAFVTGNDGALGILTNNHSLAWRDRQYPRFNCASVVALCLRAAGIVPEGDSEVVSGAILKLILRNRMFNNPHWMIWSCEV